MKITFDIVIVDECENKDAIASVHYPHEGSKITIVKGLSAIEFSDAIHHEIGHIFDWYFGKQSNDVNIREKNANIIGNAIRFRESS